MNEYVLVDSVVRNECIVIFPTCTSAECYFRENILKTAKALVEDTKTLVAGAASNQEQLATAAQNAVLTITRLAECVKQGAASLGAEQPDAQVSPLFYLFSSNASKPLVRNWLYQS